jgi:hypothetical protein
LGTAAAGATGATIAAAVNAAMTNADRIEYCNVRIRIFPFYSCDSPPSRHYRQLPF